MSQLPETDARTLVICFTCLGCGSLDDVHGEPWAMQWDKPETLFPVTCTACGGTGKVEGKVLDFDAIVDEAAKRLVPERRARGRAR